MRPTGDTKEARLSGTDSGVSDDQTGRGARIQGSGVPQRRIIEFSDTDEPVLPEAFRHEIVRSSGDSPTATQAHGDHNEYVAYVPVDALEGSKDSEDGILWANHEYIIPIFRFDLTNPESRTKKTKEQMAREKAGRLARLKSILAASTRRDWQADGPRLWVCKGDTGLRIVDLTEDDGRVELDEQWARSAAGAGSVALRVELSVCDGPGLLAKVPVVCVDSGRAFIPLPREEEDGRLVVTRWHYDLCKVISPGEYLSAHPVRSYLRRAGIVVI
jgi:hypothetical protein